MLNAQVVVSVNLMYSLVTMTMDAVLPQLVKKETVFVNVTATMGMQETDKTVRWKQQTVLIFIVLVILTVVFTLLNRQIGLDLLFKCTAI